MEEMIFVGFNYGRFKNEEGNMQSFCNAFMLEEFTGDERADFRFGGQKAAKYGCVDANVFEGIEFGTRVQCYFDSKRKISLMVPVK